MGVVHGTVPAGGQVSAPPHWPGQNLITKPGRLQERLGDAV